MIRSYPNHTIEIRIVCDGEGRDHANHAWRKPNLAKAAKAIRDYEKDPVWRSQGCTELRVEVRDVWPWTDITADLDQLLAEVEGESVPVGGRAVDTPLFGKEGA